MVARVVPKIPGKLMSGAYTSKSGKLSPSLTTGSTPGQVASNRPNGRPQVTITRPTRRWTSGAYRMNCKASPTP